MPATPATKIQAVIFDFGNVLCFPPTQEKIARAAETCGQTPEAFLSAFWDQRLEYDAGRLDAVDYWATVVPRAQLDDALLPKLLSHETEFWNHYDPRLFAWITDLRAAGLKTGILSNLPRVLGEALRAEAGFGESRFLDHFDHVTFSFELRSAKPEAAIYRHAIEGLHVPPQQALFLDDKQANVEGAHALGLQAELFTSWEEFVAAQIPAHYGLPIPH